MKSHSTGDASGETIGRKWFTAPNVADVQSTVVIKDGAYTGSINPKGKPLSAKLMAIKPDPNPQGKAALPHLKELQSWRDENVPATHPEKVLMDYLCGLLVLSADFNFKPVPGVIYHLYFRRDRWQLSLISPGEWRPHRRHDYVAACQLHRDATWSVKPAQGLAAKKHIVDALVSFEQAFREKLQASARLVDDLPHYEQQLPYYRRVLASGLASSLACSLKWLGLDQESGIELLSALQTRARGSLSHKVSISHGLSP